MPRLSPSSRSTGTALFLGCAGDRENDPAPKPFGCNGLNHCGDIAQATALAEHHRAQSNAVWRLLNWSSCREAGCAKQDFRRTPAETIISLYEFTSRIVQ